jgi:hypothetical protein
MSNAKYRLLETLVTAEAFQDLIDELIREELIYDINLNSMPEKIDCSDTIMEPDELLVESMIRVLSYYSSDRHMRDWYQHKANNEALGFVPEDIRTTHRI